MKSWESMLIGVVAVLNLSCPTTSRTLQWTGSEGLSEGDPDLSPKDTPYWPNLNVMGQFPPNWFLPIGPREGRAENFIRFGRSHADRNQANKKNNFIRLGRENPRQNNFIRLGRGGGQEEPSFGIPWKWSQTDTPTDYNSQPN